MFSLISKNSLQAPFDAMRDGDIARGIQLPPAPRADFASGEASVSADALDSVGRDNESIRNRCLDIAAKVGGLANLENDLLTVFGQVDGVMGELERTKAELIQRVALLAIERESHAELKARFKAVNDENEAAKAENEALRAEASRNEEVMRDAETRIEELEAEAEKKVALLNAGEQRRQEMETRLVLLTEELQATQKYREELDAMVAGLQSDLSSERHRGAMTEQTVLSLQASLADSQQQAARLKTDLDDANLGWDNARQKIAALEAEVGQHQAEHARMRGLWQQEADAHAADVAALQSQLEGVRAVSEVTDRILTETCDELQARVNELRQEERRAQEAIARAALAEQKLQTAENANIELGGRVAELERSQDVLLQRVKPLMKVVKEREGEAKKLQQQLDQAQARLASETARFEAERARADETIARLTESVEKEKAMKTLVEGALEADRRDRVQLQQALQSARNGQAAPAVEAAA